jgi:O-antigen/teichoic acid export membrane protein/O-antigen ligase
MGLTFFLVFMPQRSWSREAYQKDAKAVSLTIIAGTFVLSLVCMVTYVLQINVRYKADGVICYTGMHESRLWGLYNPNVGAVLAVVSLILTAFAIVEMKKKWCTIFGTCNLVLQFLVIVLAASRTVIYGSVGFLFFYLIYLLPRMSGKRFRASGFSGLWKRVLVSGMGTILLFVLLQAATWGMGYVTDWLDSSAHAASTEIVQVMNPISQRTDTTADSNGGILNGRQYIWKAGVSVWKTSPVLGVTKDSIYQLGRKQVPIKKYRRAFKQGGLHNLYLTVLAASGVVGFAILFVFLGYGLSRIARYGKGLRTVSKNGWYLASVAVVLLYLIMELFEARILYELNIHMVIFWSLAGIIKGAHDVKKREIQSKFVEKTGRNPGLCGKLKEVMSKNQRFLSNTSWLLFDKIFQMVLSLVVMSITARYLGNSAYGVLNYGLAFVNIFTSVCKLGIDAILVNEIVKNREKTAEYIGTTIVLRMASAFCSIVITGIFVWILKPGQWLVLAISLIQAVSLLFVAFDTIDYYFQSLLKSKYAAISKSAAYVTVSVFRIILVVLKADLVWFALATVLDGAAIAVGLVFFYRREKMRFSFSMDTAKYLLTAAGPYLLANLLVVIYTQMDKIMVGTLNTDSEVGIYTAAMNIANMWMFIPLAIIDSARPLIMEYRQREDEKYMSRYRQLTGVVIWISVAAGLGITVFGKLAVYILYGKSYLAAAPVLLVLIWSRLFSLLGTTRSIWLICEDLSRYVKWFVGIGALINLVLNGLWIPVHGAMGAATATLITEFAGAIILPACFRETRVMLKIIVQSLKMK